MTAIIHSMCCIEDVLRRRALNALLLSYRMGGVMRNVILVVAALAGLPAFAQVDFSGEWAPRFYEDQLERGPGPELGDYLGIPINDANRQRADNWDASIQTLPEWQCRPHSADYIWRGPSNLRVWKDVDPGSGEITAVY